MAAGGLKAAADWLDDRTGFRKVVHTALEEPVAGGASYAYVFGSVLTFVLILQMTTGILLAMYYSPSASTAWASVAYIQDQVTLGWFIRGLHGHGASAMVILAGLHLLQTATYGAYKKPREVTWLVGCLLLALILAFALTGYLLPWDQKGYWATKVATGIMGGSPVIGPQLQQTVQGGNEYGNLTITRFFMLHVFLLPAIVLGLVAVHVALFRKHGVTHKWSLTAEQANARMQPFWPDQLWKDMVAIAVVFALIVYFTMRGHGVELGAPADPASGYDARPEWYFLPLFQMLKYFHGPLEKVVALGLPVVVGAVLIGLPILDRGADRSPKKRAAYLTVLGLGFAGAGALILLAMQSDANDAALQKRFEAATAQAKKARTLALAGVPPAGGIAVYENEPFHAARKLWGERCAGCHDDGKDRKGPILAAGYNSRAWIRGLLTDPDADAYFGRVKKIQESKSKMKPAEEKGADLDALVEFVYAQSGAADADAAKVKKGKELFDGGKCSDCHFDDGESTEGEAPNLGGRGSAKWYEGLVADPGHARYFGDKNEMPAFGAKLAPAEIHQLAELVAWLRSEPI
jgi:ubiquinol-cytochrome c reductase cytochrome b subunit